MLAALQPVQEQEDDTVNDQCRRDDRQAVQFLLDDVIEHNTDRTARDDCYDDLHPQRPGPLPFLACLAQCERIQTSEVQHDHGQDGAQLDQDIEQLEKLIAPLQRQKRIKQQQMPA